MSKYVIKEGIVQKFLLSIFDAVAKGKTEKAMKVLESDPEMQKAVKALDAVKKKIERDLEREKKDPVFKKYYDKFDKELKNR